MDTSTISIDTIVIHDIPKRKKDQTEVQPTYSQSVSDLSSRLKHFFKDKINGALSSHKCFKIVFDSDSSSSASYLIKKVIDSPDSIVEHSRKLGEHLFSIQVGNNAAGILLVVFGKISNRNTCMILKLERDSGAQLNLNPKTKSFDVTQVEDLMLTQKTKIFKIALFIAREDFNVHFDGFLVDYQIDLTQKRSVTTWYMTEFLGCKAFEDPRITTKVFYNHTRTFISLIDNAIDRLKYTQDLNSYVQKNTSTISGEEFANDYFNDIDLQDRYMQFLRSKNFSSMGFPKDISSIKNQVKNFSVEFENGISINGPKGTFEKNVTMKQLAGGNHEATITSKIRKIV